MECVDIFEGMESKYREFGLEDVYGVIQFHIHGRGGGQWHAICYGDHCKVRPGVAPEPDVTITSSADNMVKMVEGRIHPAMAFLRRKVKVRGNMGLIFKLQALLSDRI